MRDHFENSPSHSPVTNVIKEKEEDNDDLQ